MSQVSTPIKSPEYKPSPESVENVESTRKVESLDLGVGIERASEIKFKADDDSASSAQGQGRPVPAQDVGNAHAKVQTVQDLLDRIRARLFTGINYKEASKETLVNHLLINHHMDIKLAYDLVEYLKAESMLAGEQE